MSKNLVIVESPAKAKTIEGYLGKDFTVKSSFGHVRDLPKKGMSIDIENDFNPEYQVTPDKKKVITELRKAAKQAETVWLATDDDREGEAIAWHLKEVLKLNDSNSKRIVFREITKPAVTSAIENPGKINVNVVDAQQARRVLDRLVGYELSPVLWKKVRYGLSAGRVQSVAVRLIVEKEREIAKHQSEASFRIKLVLEADSQRFEAVISNNLADQKQAEALLKKLADAELKVDNIEARDAKRNPSPPFTTSTLQQSAATTLGMSVKQTMTLAQKLYEKGHITYMRTDSLNLSNQARADAKQFIEKSYGKNYYKERFFKGKKGAQEAHEAIRPTKVDVEKAGGDEREIKLYKLIRSRMLASQMAEAQVKNTTVTTSVDEHKFAAKGSIVVFDGFLRVMSKKAQSDELLPELKIGDVLQLVEAEATQVFTKPPARYSEASLVKKLEELGIGRPSTYAPTISTVQARGYVEKSAKEGEPRDVVVITLKDGKVEVSKKSEKHGGSEGRLTPTDIGEVVNDFLVNNFKDIIDYDFTASVEEEFDKIAAGSEKWNTMIKDWYGPFHSEVEKGEEIDRSSVMKSREVGTDPKTKLPILAKMGRFGPMLQLGDFPKDSDKKPKFAPIPKNTSIDSVTLEQALTAFELPRSLGNTPEGEEITTNIGRFGPYVKYGSKYVSIKDDDPYTITPEKALEYIKEHQEKEKNKYIAKFEKEGIEVINGRFGPYVTNGKKNAKVPKDVDPKKITLQDAKDLLAKAPTRKKR